MRKVLILLAVPFLFANAACGAGSSNGLDTGDTVDDDGTGTDIPDTAECGPVRQLACGDSISWNTGLGDPSNRWGAYSCTARAESGPETVYLLTAEHDCTATVTLTNLEDDLDVMHLAGCDPFTCMQVDSTPMDIQDDETIAFEIQAGIPEIVVVDGYAGASGPFTIKVDCDCPVVDECPKYVSRLAECPFIYGKSGDMAPECTDTAACMAVPCAQDSFCEIYGESGDGQYCVMGNCVHCWQDTQCDTGEVCRAGRCVTSAPLECPEIPDCSAAGCDALQISETSCPTCVCSTEYFNQCAGDDECLLISHHPFKRCVNGRCAECRIDSDCDYGECLPPGICYSMIKHPSAVYGSWLIGWYGGLDHFSYFRFEPDGTMRRAAYESDGIIVDDILTGGCLETDGAPIPAIVGTWEPEMTESGFLVIRISFLSSCAPDTPVSVRFAITMADDGDGMTLVSVENPESVQFQGLRVNPLLCTPDFTVCPPPSFGAAQKFQPLAPL